MREDSDTLMSTTTENVEVKKTAYQDDRAMESIYPLTTGNTPVCCQRIQLANNITVHVIPWKYIEYMVPRYLQKHSYRICYQESQNGPPIVDNFDFFTLVDNSVLYLISSWPKAHISHN